LETLTIKKLARRRHRRVVKKPTQISLIAQIPQSDSVYILTPWSTTTADTHHGSHRFFPIKVSPASRTLGLARGHGLLDLV